MEEMGRDFSLPAIIAAILRRESSWKAFSSYCENVMRIKEEAERVRQEIESGLRRRRKRRVGREPGRRDEGGPVGSPPRRTGSEPPH